MVDIWLGPSVVSVGNAVVYTGQVVVIIQIILNDSRLEIHCDDVWEGLNSVDDNFL